jgi:three-Cys-motif partner protein
MSSQEPLAQVHLDQVGPWTEIKLEILRKYAEAYADILSKQRFAKAVGYIDGFAGAGMHLSKDSGKPIAGSPQIALTCEGFTHYHFIDLDGKRASNLRQLTAGRNDAEVHEGDCNEILLQEVLPRYRYQDYRRALCVLDPYRLDPRWEVVETAGQMGSVDIFLNFMIMDANQNVLQKDPDRASETQAARMDQFWGDHSWREVAYRQEPNLFGTYEQKTTNEDIVAAYRDRLREKAGFKYVPEPVPMRNKKGATIYYLFFASNNSTGDKIARSIFRQYRERGTRS